MPRARSTCATSSREQRAPALAALQEIIDRATVPGTTAKLEISGEFLPLVPTPAAEELFATYQAAAADAGLKVPASSPAAAPIRASRGGRLPDAVRGRPVGGNAHTPEEYLEVDSLVPRAQAMALAILRLPAEGGEGRRPMTTHEYGGSIGGGAANWFTMSKSEAHLVGGPRSTMTQPRKAGIRSFAVNACGFVARPARCAADEAI